MLKGRVWVFALSGLSQTSSFPAGFAAEHEAEVLTTGGEFIGGPGLVQIVSYSESPVGPYDELIYVPGRWKYKDGTVAHRITRIYVSTKESTENGRRNWNIPKQVADFSITTASNGSTTIIVTNPGSSTPFFHVTTTPVPVLSYIPIPFNTRMLGRHSMIVQPPLPAGVRAEEVSTTQWAGLLPLMKGTMRLTSVKPELDGKVGDGEGYPAVVPWSVGGYMGDVILDFGVPELSDDR